MYKFVTCYMSVLLIALFATNVLANEVMTDRCSADVAIVPFYDARPDTPRTVILSRDSSGWTDWTMPFTVELSGEGRIRWWCNSTTGNLFDIGTWRIEELTLGTKCKIDSDFEIESCEAAPDIKFGSSAWNGWTPDRSRCDSRSNRIRARLGPDRLLQIECLDPIGIVEDPLSPEPSTSSICSDAVQGKIAWDYYGSRNWYPGNIAQLCNGAEDTREPAWCFLHVMHGSVSWGGSTFWNWRNALDLCEGTQNAAGTISCFETQIDRGSMWQDAITACDVR